METTKEMLPEVKAYVDAIDDAERERSEKLGELTGKYPDRWEDRDQRRAFNAGRDEAYDTAEAKSAAAWAALKSSGDPLVRWITENCEEYQSEAMIVLKALPATLDELDDLAAEYDWCGTWDRFRDLAIAAGVLTVPPMSEARRALRSWARNDLGLGRRGMARLTELVDAVVREESATVTAPAGV